MSEYRSTGGRIYDHLHWPLPWPAFGSDEISRSSFMFIYFNFNAR